MQKRIRNLATELLLEVMANRGYKIQSENQMIIIDISKNRKYPFIDVGRLG